ncbi:uncharacterized protein LOC119767696 [Culex quinquefasciatus]|uniref:uncharacterized protein LOC119767696 n=1 Tax=Culex quinquefasciatus TaxID=7176 RepID=UPI0018E37F1E|nr:uncharacterized protein LOC119767696 [Culex quinquefasciatus]
MDGSLNAMLIRKKALMSENALSHKNYFATNEASLARLVDRSSAVSCACVKTVCMCVPEILLCIHRHARQRRPDLPGTSYRFDPAATPTPPKASARQTALGSGTVRPRRNRTAATVTAASLN